MSTSMFRPATRKKLKLRMALDGPSGSGKTYTALRLAFGLAGTTGRVAVIDTEHRSASKYKGLAPDGRPWEFDVCELDNYSPSTYTQVIQEAGRQGYDVLVIDSLSHAWEGAGGALDLVDRHAAKSGNSFTAWKDVTPMHREMVEAILACPCHVIGTMRSKMEYVLEEVVDKSGKKKSVPKKIGMAPIQRQGMEYEFDVVGDLDETHTLTVSKTRCPAIDGKKVVKPDLSFIAPLAAWLDEGTEAEQFRQPEPVPEPQPEPAKVKPAVHSQSEHATCNESQVSQILSLARQAGLSPEQLASSARKRGAERVSLLTYAAAEDLAAALQALASKREAASRF